MSGSRNGTGSTVTASRTRLGDGWFRFDPDYDDAPVRLLCFPFAGGGTSTYRSWQGRVGPTVQIVAVELPGRGGRFGEPLYTDMTSLVEDLSLLIGPLFDRPTMFFGHSNGALIAFELARVLERAGRPSPVRLLLSAQNPPHYRDDGASSALPREALIRLLREYNGTPAEVLGNPELLELIIPVLRADLRIGETLGPQDGVELDTGFTLIAGTRDPHTDPTRLMEWERYTRRDVDVFWVDGDHFFVDSCVDEVVACVLHRVKAHRRSGADAGE